MLTNGRTHSLARRASMVAGLPRYEVTARLQIVQSGLANRTTSLLSIPGARLPSWKLDRQSPSPAGLAPFES